MENRGAGSRKIPRILYIARMNLLLLFLAGCGLFLLAYRFYGGFAERQLGTDHRRSTPAHTKQDGVDFVPTRAAVLFGHHFSSIAGAGPIVGPIIAGLAFGWGPAMLWILVGAIFIGGAHDFTALVASIRHEGRSIAQICRERVGPFCYYGMLGFILLTMVYVIIVFLDLTASSFLPATAAIGAAATENATLSLKQGGAVATASWMYVGLAVLFGFSLCRFRLPLRTATLIFVPLVFGAIWLGIQAPLSADLLAPLVGDAKSFWLIVLLAYCLLASVLPVWLLLQPRDYLSSFLLYACLGGGVIGLAATALTGSGATIQYPMLVTWTDPKLGFIFPALFITIACGAVSGFHAMVASGTSSKQIACECDAKKIGYGAMLVEGVLALLAVSTIMILPKATGENPIQVFARGLGTFLSHIGFSPRGASVFAMLSASTFLLTTLDTCTRLARFLLQELLGLSAGGWIRRVALSLAVLAVPTWAVFQKIPGPNGVALPAWNAIWPAFGASNQLLAALALLVTLVWLRSRGQRAWFIAIPMVFMCGTTLYALSLLVFRNLFHGGSRFVGGLSLALAVLAVSLIVSMIRPLALRPAAVESSPEDTTPRTEG